MTAELPKRLRLALAEAGFDISRLAHESPASVEREVQDRAERAATAAQAIKQRLIAGRLPASKRAEAKRRLERVSDDLGRLRQLLKMLTGRKPAPQYPEPTIERVRHAGEVIAETSEKDGTPLRAPRHRVQWPVDRVGPTVPAEDYNAAQRFREAFMERQARPSTVDWDGGGGSVPGSRVPVSDYQLHAAEEFDVIWSRLSRPIRTIVANFVLELAPPGKDAPMTLQEFGRVYGNTRDDRGARVGSIVAIKIACAEIAKEYRAYEGPIMRSGGQRRSAVRVAQGEWARIGNRRGK
jgi:hypothetical protein